MERTSNPSNLRLAILAVIALLLVVIVARKFKEPSAVLGTASSPSSNFHLVPTEKANDTKLVIFDQRHLLVFQVQNNGVRLNGWRTVSNDYQLWDTSLLKGASGMESSGGSGCMYLLPDPKKPTQTSFVKNMTDWLNNANPKIPIKVEGK